MADEEVPTPDPISENPDDQPDTPDEQPEAPIVETTTALLPSTAGFEVVNTTLEDEMRQSYLNYAMSTIISRARPDVRDGLKPVQRRILMAMSDLNLTPAAQQRKSAKIAGDTSGNYHPHGEAVIYPTMVRMAQDFSLRYPLVDGQGNFGSIDGDPPAAMRYTEARMSHFAMEMLQDLDRDTVNWTENYDQTREEPTVLPGKFPNLICNGGSGIAVGMATNIPPHNLREIVDALYHLIDNPDATSDELMTFVKGPDFPTYGLILGTKGIRLAYATGRGSVIMQARTTIEPMENGRNAIIITELPYQVIKQRLIEQIAELVKQKKIEGIVNLNDYTDKTGMRVVVELKREAYPKKVLNFLLKHTPMRSTFGVNMIALIEGQPQILSLPQVLNAFLKHRREVIVRRTIFELNKAKARAHILEGLRIALDFLDEIIALIRASRTAEIARTEMMARFTLSQLQADAILQMQLRTLTGLAREQVENEYKELLRQIGFYEDILATPARVEAIIRTELKFLRDKYGDERRTRIVPMEAEEIGDEDLIPEEEMIISITRDGYIKRVPKETY
ncbi:MAG: gyrase subunit, partial [Capsulimonas sp.]|nr:gyrase subunit [Capsulimonas sp.]